MAFSKTFNLLRNKKKLRVKDNIDKQVADLQKSIDKIKKDEYGDVSELINLRDKRNKLKEEKKQYE